MTKLDRIFKLNSQVVSTELDPTEAVLLHLDNQRYYTLNETGWFIWKCIEKGLNIQQITDNLVEQFEVEPAKAQQCVLDLIDDLLSEKLVEQ